MKRSAVTVQPSWLLWMTTRCAIALTLAKPLPRKASPAGCSTFGVESVPQSSARLRFGELASLWRGGIDEEALTVRRAQTELQNGRPFDKAPKSPAGVGAASVPAELLDEITRHRERRAGMGNAF
ncbi:hypothetical protein ABZS81_14895 [Streptomyces sp. NPDC005318]|uniref:hypothetical protein n=1 Tax=Streptomyces sp. NPDC005318 TaxID=3157031 RepID=UPI0033A2B477